MLSHRPDSLGRFRLDGQRRDREFVRAAAIELHDHRINAVSPTVLEESMDDYDPYFRGFEAVPANASRWLSQRASKARRPDKSIASSSP